MYDATTIAHINKPIQIENSIYDFTNIFYHYIYSILKIFLKDVLILEKIPISTKNEIDGTSHACYK